MIAVGLDGEAAVLDYPDTAFGPQIDAQAWSAGELPTEPLPYREHHSWAKAARIAAVAVTAAMLGAAGLVVALGGSDSSASAPATVTVAPHPPKPVLDIETAPDPPSTLRAVPDARHVTHDGEYLQALFGQGFSIDTDPSSVVGNAHKICHNLGIEAGMPSYRPEHWAPRSALAYWMLHDDPEAPPGWSLENMQFLVDTASAFYCPEYR